MYAVRCASGCGSIRITDVLTHVTYMYSYHTRKATVQPAHYFAYDMRAACAALFFVLFVALPYTAHARITIPDKTVIAMDFSPMSGSFLYPGDSVAAYKKNIADMRGLGVGALADDMFNASRDRSNMAAISTAVKQWNQEHNDNFCWFILGDAMDTSLSPLVGYVKQYGNGPEYCQVNGKPVVAVWNGGRAGASGSTYVNGLLNPLKSAGLDPYFIYERGGNPGVPSKVAQDVKTMRNAGFDVGFYDFGVGASGKSVPRVTSLNSALNPLGTDVFPGFSSAYWQVCGKRTSNYIEHDGFRGWQNYWKGVIPGGAIANSKFVWLTMWSDIGEDNQLTLATRACKAPYSGNYCAPPFSGNGSMPTWTHRGYYQFAKRYVQWFKTGTEPAITHDTVYFAYRQHPSGLAAPSGDQCVAHGTPINNSGSAKDQIYVTTELTAPATLTVTLGGSQVGSYNAPAGTAHFDVPWGSNRGNPTFKLQRGGSTVLSGQGQLEITNTPKAFGGAGTRNFGTYADFLSTDTSTGSTYDGGGGGSNTGGGTGVSTVSCTNSYTSGSAVPTGYGASYNVLSAARELLLRATCTNRTTATTEVGSGTQGQYVYHQAYYWTGTQWKLYTLTGTKASDIWLTGLGTGSISLRDGLTYFVGYVCQQENNVWKCGCRDKSCATSYWQIQGVVAH